MTRDADRESTPHVLVIGGGIAGIAAALRIRALNTSCRITLADSAPRLGGKIAGDIVDGCVVDGGADVCIGAKLRDTRLFDALDLGARVIRVNPGNLPTFERVSDVLRELPARFDGELLTFRSGVRELIDLCCAALNGVSILTDAVAESIDREDGRFSTTFANDSSVVSNAVIVATPARASAALLTPVVGRTAAAIGATEYPATTTVTMAWHAHDVPRALAGTGYLVADTASAVSACTWTSSKNPTHARDGIVLLRGYLRGSGLDAVALVRDEVASTLGIIAAPLFTRVYEWPAGIAAYPAGHEAAVQALGDALAGIPGLFIAGSAFHGVGIPDCIRSGERAAEAAAAYLELLRTEVAA